MKVHKLLVAAIIVCSLPAFAQVNESFSDGDYTANPAWATTAGDWLVNPSFQLQSNNLVANSTFFITTPSTLAVNTQWEIFMALPFNPSSVNYVDVFLTASLADLSNNSNTGYFVRVGNTDDDVSLYRKDAGGVVTKIIDGANGILNTSNNMLKIRVIRAAGNQFTLFRDITGTGNSYISEGTVADGTSTTSSFFGILVRQSTAGFFQSHYFDNIEVKPYVPDVLPPLIQSVTAITVNSADVLFNEPVDVTSSQTLSNYSVNNGIGNPVTAIRDATNSSLVHLNFAANFPNGVNNTITINGVRDVAGNGITNGMAVFSFYVPQRYDVVIDEIFADPSPQVALPNAEFIELKNTSTQPINLQGWKIASASTTSNALPFYILPADSFLILTSTSNAALLSGFGRVMGVTSFPALDNTGTTLSLISRENTTIHAVNYNVAWYNNAVKSDGGWSLEMVDTKNPCAGSYNWKASTDAKGGTPAAKNSVDGANKDVLAPALLRAAAPDSVTVVLTFDDPLDSLKAAAAANYSISDGVGTPVSAIALSPLFNKVQLRLSTPLVRGKVYIVTANNITDCSGNVLQTLRTARLGLSSVVDSSGVIINEVLFNPKSNSVDFVELYNRTNLVFDLKDIYIANRSSSTNIIGSVKQLSTESILLFPGDFYVVSESGATVKQNYVAKNPGNFADVTMPSYPDDKGFVVLLNAQGRVVDELDYDQKWHFGLIDNDEGISLERIDYNKPTQSRDNWFSAASTAGYGTPSYQNSQFRSDLQLQGEVAVLPKVFSPDNDGTDDFSLINYAVAGAGNVANITIFDAEGRAVKVLAKNATLASTGSFRWDGLDDKMRKVPVGAYIIYTEIFNLGGKKKSFKNSVVVAARF